MLFGQSGVYANESQACEVLRKALGDNTKAVIVEEDNMVEGIEGVEVKLWELFCVTIHAVIEDFDRNTGNVMLSPGNTKTLRL
mmetsp:Transcript_26520/g.30643  ORF Transcript_26520/g.30643 Transcript_26520/m.30643 type:complete len:83 (+) Transcript_26520:4-252(+)